MRRALVSLLVPLGLLTAPGLALPAGAAADIGDRGPGYGSALSPTAEKPQSKLWVVGSTWFGSLYNSMTSRYEIYRREPGLSTWFTTGEVVDTRPGSLSDALWDGNKLYIVSAGLTSSSADSAKLMRYSYDATSQSFALDAGFPVTVSSGGGAAVVMDKDSTGALWVTFTQNDKVYVNHSTTDDRTWRSPYVVPGPGATNLMGSDGSLSSIVSYNGKVGVMWSNQNPSEWAMHFAFHRDGDPDDTWTRNTVVQQAEWSDDHISLKALDGDPAGQIFAATKTSLNGPSEPLLLLNVLGQDGVWRRYTYGTVADQHTRPLILIDRQNRELYMFTSAPCCSGGVVYYKKTSLDNLSFEPGLGTPFLESSTDLNINNVASTKQPLDGKTDLLAIAGDDHTHKYWTNKLDLGPDLLDTDPPETAITLGPSGVSGPTATFVFSSNEAGSTFQCKLDTGVFASCSSPKRYQGLANGEHTFSVRATDPAGNDDFTPATRTWTVDDIPPETTITSAPPATTSSADATIAFGASEPGSTFECKLDAADYRPCSSPVNLEYLRDGTHSFSVRSTDPAGNLDATPASHTWTVSGGGVLDLRLSPEADATVKSASPKTNFGKATTLQVDTSPLMASFLRFDVPPAGAVKKATLRLFVGNATDNGPHLYTTQAGWSETAINWSNRPPRTSGIVGNVGAAGAGTWVEYDVTSLVSGGGPNSFELSGDTPDGVDFNSAEASSHRPELLVLARSLPPSSAPSANSPARRTAPAGGNHGGGSNGADLASPVIEGLGLFPRAFAPMKRASTPLGALARRKRPRGTTIRFRLSEDAKLSFGLSRRSRGRSVGSRCVPARASNRSRPRCIRYARLRGIVLEHGGTQGLNTLHFSGWLNGRPLKPDLYRLVVRPVDAAGNQGAKRRIGFRVLRAKARR
jgi:hypothetical protein